MRSSQAGLEAVKGKLDRSRASEKAQQKELDEKEAALRELQQEKEEAEERRRLAQAEAEAAEAKARQKANRQNRNRRMMASSYEDDDDEYGVLVGDDADLRGWQRTKKILLARWRHNVRQLERWWARRWTLQKDIVFVEARCGSSPPPRPSRRHARPAVPPVPPARPLTMACRVCAGTARRCPSSSSSPNG